MVESIITALIYDISKSFVLDIMRDYLPLKNDNEIDIILKKEIDKNYYESLEELVIDEVMFKTFISLPHIRREIVEFINFKNFIISERIAKKNKHRLKEYMQQEDEYDETYAINIPTTRIQLIEKLVSHADNYYSFKKTQCPFEVYEVFFTTVFASLEKSILGSLTQDMINMQYITRTYIEHYFTILNEKIDFLAVEESYNYTQQLDSYKSLIKENFNKFELYGASGMYSLDEFYCPPRLDFRYRNYSKRESQMSTFDNNSYVLWKDIFLYSNSISIIGGAGYGKTLFLKFLMTNFSELTVSEPDSIIPIYCNVREYKDFINHTNEHSILEFLAFQMRRITALSSTELHSDIVDNTLKNGNCLILFDALDEVDAHLRKELSDKIIAYIKHINPSNKVIITTRDRSLIPNTDIVYSICKLNDTEISNYLDQMITLELFLIESKDEFMLQTKSLVSKEFLSNHLLLSLMVKIFSCEKKLPENKIELYELCAKYIVFFREVEKQKLTKDYDLDALYSLIRNDSVFELLAMSCYPKNTEVDRQKVEICLYENYSENYLCDNEFYKSLNIFLEFCSYRTELFILGNTENHYKFFHRSLYEYYYARYLVTTFTNNTSLLEKLYDIEADSEIIELNIALLIKFHYINRYKSFINYLEDILLGIQSSNYISTFLIYIQCLLISKEKKRIRYLYDFLCSDTELLLFIPEYLINDVYDLLRIIFTEEELVEFLYEEAFDYIVVWYGCEILGSEIRIDKDKLLFIDKILSCDRRLYRDMLIDRDLTRVFFDGNILNLNFVKEYI